MHSVTSATPRPPTVLKQQSLLVSHLVGFSLGQWLSPTLLIHSVVIFFLYILYLFCTCLVGWFLFLMVVK